MDAVVLVRADCNLHHHLFNLDSVDYSRPKLNRHRCWRGSVFLERAAGRLPDPVLASTAMAYEPNRRSALPARRQPLVRGGGKGAGAGAGRARPPPNQVAL